MDLREFNLNVNTRSDTALASKLFNQFLSSNPTFDDLLVAWNNLPDAAQKNFEFVFDQLIDFYQNHPFSLMQLANSTCADVLNDRSYIIGSVLKHADIHNVNHMVDFINTYKEICIKKFPKEVIEISELTSKYKNNVNYLSLMNTLNLFSLKKFDFSVDLRNRLDKARDITLDNLITYGESRPQLSPEIYNEIISSHKLIYVNKNTNYYLSKATDNLERCLKLLNEGKTNYNIGATYSLARKQLKRIKEQCDKNKGTINIKRLDEYTSALIKCKYAIMKRPEQVANCFNHWKNEDNTEIADVFGIDTLVKGLILKQQKGEALFQDFKNPIIVNSNQFNKFLKIREFPENAKFIFKVNNISELSIEQLQQLEERGVRNIIIDVADKVKHYYSTQNLIECKKTIEDMLEPVIIPGDYDHNKEKKIATQIMYIIAKTMSYDSKTLDKEDPIRKRIDKLKQMENGFNVNSEDSLEKLYKELHKLSGSIRNIEGGVTEGRTVCLGYSEILRNILSMFGIKCNTILGSQDGKDAHAWNQIEADGKWYNVDLTFARKYIQNRQLINPAQVKRLLFAHDYVFYQSHPYDIDNIEDLHSCNTQLNDRIITEIFNQPKIGTPYSKYIKERETGIFYNKKAQNQMEKKIKKINVEHKRHFRKTHIGPARRFIGKILISILNKDGKKHYRFIDEGR